MNRPSLIDLLRTKKKDRRGSLAIEIVIGCFIFLMVFCLFLDVVMIGWRFSVVSQTNSYIARTVGLQGGVLGYTPNGFPGGDNAYLSTSEMANSIQQNFAKAGIKPGEYTVTINGVPLTSGISVDYRGQLNIETNVKYNWTMINNFIPGDLSNWINSKRSVLSEFKYRYDTWSGE